MNLSRTEKIAAAVTAAAALLLGGFFMVRSSPSNATSDCKPFEPQPGDGVWLWGDSLGVGMSAHLRSAVAAAFPGVPFSSAAVQGYNARQTLSKEIAGREIRGFSIVSLGSNDAAGNVSNEAIQVQAVIDALASNGRLLWVLPPNFNIEHPPAPATKEKQMAFIEQVQSDSRVEILVPDDVVMAHLSSGDHIHLDPAGYKLLAEQIVARMLCS